jgi:hypothetical protein
MRDQEICRCVLIIKFPWDAVAVIVRHFYLL